MECNVPPTGNIAAGGAYFVPIEQGWYASECNSEGVCQDTLPCPPGTIGTSGFLCQHCPVGKTSPSGSTSCFDCQKGKFADALGATCKNCPSGFHQPNDNEPSTSCSSCPLGYGAFLNDPTGRATCLNLNWQSASDCASYQYLDNKNVNDPTSWKCAICPKGASCQGLVTWYNLGSRFGYARCGKDSEDFERCFGMTSCLGAPNPTLEGKYYRQVWH